MFQQLFSHQILEELNKMDFLFFFFLKNVKMMLSWIN